MVRRRQEKLELAQMYEREGDRKKARSSYNGAVNITYEMAHDFLRV